MEASLASPSAHPFEAEEKSMHRLGTWPSMAELSGLIPTTSIGHHRMLQTPLHVVHLQGETDEVGPDGGHQGPRRGRRRRGGSRWRRQWRARRREGGAHLVPTTHTRLGKGGACEQRWK